MKPLENLSPENLSPENQRSFRTLIRSLAMGRGNFSLIFARCNYANLSEKIRKLLREQSAVTVQELYLPASAKSLYGALSDAVKENSPQALVVFGIESVVSLDDLLTAANRSRDRFRQDFPFPIVLWVTDGVLSKLGRLANDFNTWGGPPIHFTVSPEDLREFLCQKFEQALNCQQSFKLEGCEVEAIEKDLWVLGERLDPELQACWEFIKGIIEFQNKHIDAAIGHYQKTLAICQQHDQLERQGIVCMKLADAYNRKAELDRAQNQHYWQQTQTYVRQALACFQSVKREELVAQSTIELGEVLQHLEAWQELQALATEALEIHKNTGPANLVAQDYAFLAQTALHQDQWERVNELAKQGLDVLEQAESPKHERSLHLLLLLLAKSQRRLGQKPQALKTLQEAKQIPPGKNSPQLYIQILEELQELHRDSQQYLEAFEFKLEQREIESKYRLLAFIGAGRLQPLATEALNINLENCEQVADAVEEIVAASGRQQDVNNLIGRVGRPDCKLTVLYGQSGVGKSSIVQAGLVPALKLTPFDGWDAVPVLLQNYDDWVQELGKKLAAALVEVKAVFPLPHLDTPAAMLKRLGENENCRLVTVLIFDQFEEFFFVYKKPEIRRQFYLFLSQVLHISYVKVILSLREDYLHYLLEASRIGNLDIIDNDILNKNILYYLGNLSRSDAKAVISSLTERSQFYLEPELVDALVEELASELGEVRPIELQVVGSQLQAEKITTLARYQQNGPKKALVERFLQAVVQDCGADNQNVAKLILYVLTDENNTRPQKTREVLELELELKAATLDLVLEILVKSGLVLKILSTPADRYQLVHDYLVAFIRNSQFNPFIAELEREREQRKLTQQKLIEVQKQQLKAARRQTVTLVGLLAIVSGVAIIATLVGINTFLISLIASSINNKNNLERLVSAIKIGKFLNKFQLGVINETRIYAFSELNQAAATVQEINRLEGHNGSITKVVFSDDGTTIGTGSEDKTAIIWSINGQQIGSLIGHSKSITSIAFSKDNKTVVTGSKDRTVKFWNFKGDKFVLVKDLTEHNGSVTSLSISPDGQTIASASEDKTVKLWSRDGQLIRTLQHPERIAIVSFSPDGQMIAAAGKDEIVKLWNLDGKETGDKINNYGTLTMSFSGDGKTLIFGNNDGTQKFYQLNNGKLIKNLNNLCRVGRNVSSIAVIADSQQMIYVDSYLGNPEKVVLIEERFKGSCSVTRSGLFTHNDSITDLILSPSGKILATASKDKTVKLWNIKNDSITNYRSSDTQANKALFSPNGQIIATNNSDDETVKLWRRDGTFLRNIQGDSSVMSFSPDSQAIITGSREDIIKLWTYEGQEVTWKNNIGSIASIKISPDGQRIATVGSDYTVRLWKRDGTPIGVLYKYPVNRNRVKEIPTVVFSPDSQSIATFGNDNKVKLWKTDGTSIKTLSGHAQSLEKVVFSNDSQFIATIGDDNLVNLWKNDGTPIAILTRHQNRVIKVIFSPNNKILASLDSENFRSGNSQIRLWRSNGTPLSNPIDDYGAQEIYFSPDSDFIASTHQGGTIKLWNPNGTVMSTLIGHKDTVNDLIFSRDGQRIVSASNDGTVRIWDRNPTTGKFDKNIYKILRQHTSGVNSVSISPDSKIIASASDDKTVKLWDREGKLIQQLEPSFRGTVQEVAFSEDGEIIIAYSLYEYGESRKSYLINLWKKEGKQFKYLKTIEGHTNGNQTFSASNDRKAIAYVSKEDKLTLWNINNGSLRASFQGHNNWINSVAFSPDGQFIASASDDKTIKLWDKSGQFIQNFSGHTKPVNSISFNPKDPAGQLASASDDKTVRLWRNTGKEMVEPIKHSEEVKSVAFSPNGETIVSASGGNINFWSKNGNKINTRLNYENDSNNSNDLSFSSDGSMLALAGTPVSLYLPNSFWFKGAVIFGSKSRLNNVSFSPEGKVIADVKDSQGYAWNFLNLDEALEHNCELARNYLKNNPKVEESDKHLCDDIKVRSKLVIEPPK